MRLAFMGTPAFAAALLPDLSARHDVACVYTQPAKPRGRGQSTRLTPVHEAALVLGLPVRTPETLKTAAAVAEFQALGLDAAVVVAYGQILRDPILEAPALGCFNVHASLLPRWRGAAPIQRALMAGDAVTGVQVMRMTAGLDEGPILSTAVVAIAADDTAGSLHDRLLDAARALLPRTLADIEQRTAIELSQDIEGATYARKITTAEARIDWRRSAVEVDRMIRGLSPTPGAWFELGGPKGSLRMKALNSRMGVGRGEPGEILDESFLIACGEGVVQLLVVQREGRRPQSAADFLRGLGSPHGLRFL